MALGTLRRPVIKMALAIAALVVISVPSGDRAIAARRPPRHFRITRVYGVGGLTVLVQNTSNATRHVAIEVDGIESFGGGSSSQNVDPHDVLPFAVSNACPSSDPCAFTVTVDADGAGIVPSLGTTAISIPAPRWVSS